MMKRLPVWMFILFSSQVARAQKDSAGRAFFNNQCEHQYMSLAPKKNKNKPIDAFPFRAIEVVDYRPDSSRIGLFVAKGQQQDLLFNAPACSVIKSFLNKGYANPLASKTLLVVIKELWLSDVVFKKYKGEMSSPLRSRIHFRAETYIKEFTGYVPLSYFDTIITSPKAMMNTVPFRLPALMTAFMEKIHSLDITSVNLQNKRMLSFAAVDAYSSKNFLHAMDTAGTLLKGVYASFEDFRNNKPSVFNYEIEREKNSFMTLNLKDEQGKSYYSRKMWGFCDGQQTYVMMDGNLFPILTYDRAYYVYGSKEYRVKKTVVPFLFSMPGAYVYGATAISEKVTRKLRFYRLDMETGEIL